MGITASTPENIVVGAGNFLVDDADVGATAGDNVYRVEQVIFEPDLNGVPGMLLGTQYKTREEAILEANMPEVSIETVALLLPSWVENPAGTLSFDGTRRIALDQFHNYELAVPGLVNLFRFLADNAINQGNAEWSGQDAGMMSPRGEFHSKWSAAALTTSPHRIIVEALGS